MANTDYVTVNKLTLQAAASRKKVLLFGVPVVLLSLFFFQEVSLSAFLTMVLLIIYLNIGAIKRAGAKGEDAALRQLMALPDDYHIFNQLCVPNEKSRTGFNELDFVVLGPNGLFVIEVKNNKGEIVGDENKNNWPVYKIGQQGTPYTASMRNPLKQAKNQVWLLSQHLKNSGHKNWVQGLVFLAHPDSSFEFRGSQPSLPILHQSGLAQFIQSCQVKYPFAQTNGVLQELIELKAKEDFYLDS